MEAYISAGQTGDYTGVWAHTGSPDTCRVLVYTQTEDFVGLVIIAEKMGSDGIPTRTTFVKKDHVKLHAGKAQFRFKDTFLNHGTCSLRFASDSLIVSFQNVKIDPRAGWCITVGEGHYRKIEELSELDAFNGWHIISAAERSQIP